MKKKNKGPNYVWRIMRLFAPFKWRIIWTMLLGIVGVVLFSFTPTFTRNVFNHLEYTLEIGPTMSFIYQQLIILGVLALLNEIFQIICSFGIINIENVVQQEKIIEVKRKLDVVPISHIEQFAAGDLNRRVANLSGMIIRNSLVMVFRIFRTTFFYITTAIAMFQISWILALVVIASLPLCILTAKAVSNRTQRYFNNNNQVIINAFSYVDKKITLHEFYRLHGIEGAEQEYEHHNENETRATIAEDVAIGFNTIYIAFIQNFMFLLVTVVFGILFVNGNLPEFGALPAFLVFSNRFLANAVVVTEATNLLQSINARAQKVFEILDLPEMTTEKEHIDIDNIGNISFKNVSVEQGGEQILNNVSFDIKRGSSVAFVGQVGSGKSRIVEILSKLEPYKSGEITIDGANLEEITATSYHNRFGIAFPQPFIFRGTIAENLLYGIRRTLPENVMNVTKKLGSHDFIVKSPRGYETEITDGTTQLSRSQKQAINVARMVLKGPDLFVFNEAMSAADPITEKETIERIITLNPRQTKIFVTNRLSSIEKCDYIFFMDRGKIVESGTHTELMAKGKRYYSAYVIS